MQMVHSANTDRVDDGSFNNKHLALCTICISVELYSSYNRLFLRCPREAVGEGGLLPYVLVPRPVHDRSFSPVLIDGTRTIPRLLHRRCEQRRDSLESIRFDGCNEAHLRKERTRFWRKPSRPTSHEWKNDSTTASESKQLFPTKPLPRGCKHALQLSSPIRRFEQEGLFFLLQKPSFHASSSLLCWMIFYTRIHAFCHNTGGGMMKQIHVKRRHSS